MQTVGVVDFRQCHELTILFHITAFVCRIGRCESTAIVTSMAAGKLCYSLIKL